MNNFQNEITQDQDDFELEITDLPPSGKSHYVLANLVAFGSRFSPTLHAPRSSQKSPQIPLEDDDFELEITDLPEDVNPPPALMRPIRWPNARSRASAHIRARQLFTAGGVLIILGILLFGNLPLLRSRVFDLFAAATPEAVSSVSVAFSPGPPVHYGSGLIISGEDIQVAPEHTANHLDSVPACPQVSLLQSSAAPLLKGLGQSPLWVTGFTGPAATLNHLTRSDLPLFGWYQEIKLVLDTGYDGNILIQGGTQGGGSLPWFGDSSAQMWVNTLTVNPRQPFVPGQLSKDGQHMTLVVSLYVPRAGCYYLQADWAGGSWMGYFAAGKGP